MYKYKYTYWTINPYKDNLGIILTINPYKDNLGIM